MMAEAASKVTDEDCFLAFARPVKAAVEGALASFFARRLATLEPLGADASAVVSALGDLATRGGKRVRAVLLAAAYEACGGPGGAPAVVQAGVAVEILHAYLLVHDDWMDGDEVRRGGPSVHAMLRDRFGARDAGDACAVLAGDYGAALALEALVSVPLPPASLVAAMQELARMEGDVVLGQVLDVRGAATTPAAVERMHALKTASYTVRAPLVIGAALAGAPAAVREVLAEAAEPLGVAFQLQDDLLGTFGDPARTGKPARTDILRGKRTALVAELEGDRRAAPLLARVLGVPDAPEEEVEALVRCMVECGARARVESRMGELARVARDRLEAIPLPAEGKSVLRGAAAALVGREA